jgi:5-methylcytosine-specific restriction protein A
MFPKVFRRSKGPRSAVGHGSRNRARHSWRNSRCNLAQAEHRKDKGKHYGRAWRKLRKAQLDKSPLCERCTSKGRVVAATVVNHKVRHRGNTRLLMDPGNLESVCERCHNSDIQREERAEDNGKPVAGVDGYPVNGSW